jgi:hypothetical protein
VLGVPLLITAGEARPPDLQEVLVASGVADYVGVQPGAEAIVEFVYRGAGEAITQRFDGFRLIGTFDVAGPDQIPALDSSSPTISAGPARSGSSAGPKAGEKPSRSVFRNRSQTDLFTMKRAVCTDQVAGRSAR